MKINSATCSDNSSHYAWVDCLRSALTLLVVGHHAALAYTTFANFVPARYIDSTHPIVDNNRSVALDIFQNFNDIFFMSLMFFIGGLFMHQSILKKQFINFVKDRFNRLFLPFISIGTVLMLVAHIPAYYAAQHSFGLERYVQDFFCHESWPVGPPWFIWVLFIFNLIFSLINNPLRKQVFTATALERLAKYPLLLISLLVAFTWLLYVPLALIAGPGKWTGIGPFDFQLSRILLYFGYFIIGAQIGCGDMNNTIFNKHSPLMAKWKIWIVGAAVSYALLTTVVHFHVLEQMVTSGLMAESIAWMLYFGLFVLSCSLSCVAFICFFRMKFEIKNKFWHSLSKNAYLIYLIHYVFVLWIQFALREVELHAVLKFLIVFICSLSASWLLSTLLRKNEFIAKYL